MKKLLSSILYQLQELRETVTRLTDERFEKGPNYALIDEKCRYAKCNGGSWDATVIGTRRIKDGIHEWRVRSSGLHIQIGVAPAIISQFTRCNSDKCGWYFYHNQIPNGGNYLTAGTPSDRGANYNAQLASIPGLPNIIYKPQYEITIHLDVTQRSLAYRVDGSELFVAFSGLTITEPLCLVVLLFQIGNEVELLEYKKIS